MSKHERHASQVDQRRFYNEKTMGEVLVERTVGVVNEALRSKLPSEISNRLVIKPSQLNFTKSANEIRAMEADNNRTRSPLLSVLLQEAGLCDDAISSLRVTNNLPTELVCSFWQPNKENEPPTIFIDKDVLKKLKVKEMESRLNNAGHLGQKLIELSLENLPTTTQLPKIHFQQVVNNATDRFFKNISIVDGSENVDQDNINSAKQQFKNLINDDEVKFIARGAEIHIVLRGQDTNSSELVLGYHFNQGVIALIAESIKMKLSDLLINRIFLANKMKTFVRSIHSDAISAQKILHALQQTTTLTDKNLVYAFQESSLPFSYISSPDVDDKKFGKIVDQWIYPD